MSKRKSEGDGRGRPKKVKDDPSQQTLEALTPCRRIFNAWSKQICDEHGCLQKYFETHFSSKDTTIELLKYINETFPPQSKLKYADPTTVTKPGPAVLRPWMLPWSRQCGFKGTLEPDTAQQLIDLIILQGMMSNPDEGGVERLTISSLRPQMGGTPDHSLCLSDLDGSEIEDVNFADPHSFMVVKGWTRMFCCYAVLLCCQQQPGFLEVLDDSVKSSFSSIYCTVICDDDSAELVVRNRCITLSSTVRKKPNACVLLHQMIFLRRISVTEDEAWSKASQLASAYQIGRAESGAALALLNSVDKPIVDALSSLVARYTMHRFLTHDSIKEGVFNRDFCSAVSAYSAWPDALTNSPAILELLVQRLEGDWLAMNPKLRRPFTAKDVECLQRNCAAFIAAFDVFESKFPSAFVRQEEAAIRRAFMYRHMDADLTAMLENKAPPAPLECISAFNTACCKFEKKVTQAREEAQEEAAQKMALANVQQCESKVASDIAQMQGWCERVQDHNNRQGALDLRYLSAREAKGKQYIQDLMGRSQVYRQVASGLTDFASELLRYQMDTGARPDALTMLILDASLWPLRPILVDEVYERAKGLCIANPNAIILALLPLQANHTESSALSAHRRSLEDRLMTMECYEMSLAFKDSGHGGDKRRRSQPCIAAVPPIHKNSFGFSKSKALLGLIGPVSRARVMDLWCDDVDRPPTPAQRVQQRGVPGTREILEAFVENLEFPESDEPTPIFICDMMVSKYNEWGRACWELQHWNLNGKGKGASSKLDWRFFACASEDDMRVVDVAECEKWMAGHILTEYWDTCSEAGPANRAATAFEEAQPALEVLAVDGGKLVLPNSWKSSLGSKAAEIEKALVKFNSQQSPSGSPMTQQPPQRRRSSRGPAARTQCEPAFSEGDSPMNPNAVWESPATMLQGEFEVQKVPIAMCRAAANDKLQVALTTDHQLYLLNFTGDEIEFGPAEMFGYNVGSFTEKPRGVAMTNLDTGLMFNLSRDTDMLVYVDNGNKVPMCFANLACLVAKSAGLTELTVEDHTATQRLYEDQPLPFRYSITGNPKINFFEPKKLPDGSNLMELRYSMFGAAYLSTDGGGLKMVPQTTVARTLWEVRLEHSRIRSMKPKSWLLARVTVPAGMAIKLSQD